MGGGGAWVGSGGRPGARPRSRGAAEVEPRPVPTDVLEAPSMGCERDGGPMEVSSLGVLGFAALPWAPGSNDGGGLSLCSKVPPDCLKLVGVVRCWACWVGCWQGFGGGWWVGEPGIPSGLCQSVEEL